MIEIAHVKGFLIQGGDGIEISDKKENRWRTSIVEEIAKQLPDDVAISEEQKNPNHDYSDGVEVSAHVTNVFLRMYFSDTEKTLEEVQEAVILTTMGALDLYQEWYGYSEFTIEGYNVINFKIGNHDLETILTTYIGKYVHIVLEKSENLFLD